VNSWPKLLTRPLKKVNALQTVTPPAMTARRDRRSLSTPNGSAASEKTKMYAEPSQPSCESLRARSRLIGSNSA
jgi:hypothetical protein